MKKIAYGFALYLALSLPTLAETINVNVNGMVCAFCAQGIEAKFKKVSDVDEIHVDLDHGLVQLHTTDDGLTDDAIQKIITEAGYTVVAIKRGAS